MWAGSVVVDPGREVGHGRYTCLDEPGSDSVPSHFWVEVGGELAGLGQMLEASGQAVLEVSFTRAVSKWATRAGSDV
jgi:hypothetical protein